MIEKILIDYLTPLFPDASVLMEVPKDRPSKFITIERTGGSEEEHVYHSTIVIDSYDTTLAKTIELNDRVIKAMKNAIQLDEITSCQLNSNYNDTNKETKEYRYGALFDLTHY